MDVMALIHKTQVPKQKGLIEEQKKKKKPHGLSLTRVNARIQNARK